MDTRKVTLVSVLFMGYLASDFLALAFPFVGVAFSVVWNGIMMEYLGYSVFIYYLLYCIPVIPSVMITEGYFENLFSLANSLSEVNFLNHPLLFPLSFLV